MKSSGKTKKEIDQGMKNHADRLVHNFDSSYQMERNILLALSDAIIKVREKDDLIKIFSSRLKQLFYFTHAVISLIDKDTNSYYPFLFDTSAMHIRHRSELPNLLSKKFTLDDPFIDMVSGADFPVSFLLDDIITSPGVPAFIKVNHDTGIKQAMIVPLNNKSEMIGYVFIYSDRPDIFADAFKQILYAIAPLLSSAVANIIYNDEIKNKEFITRSLLSLSNEMVTVRDKDDMLKVISYRLKKVIYFTHCVMLGQDENANTYHTFLTDPDSPIKGSSEYPAIVKGSNPVDDGIFNVACASETPVVLDMESFNLNQAPLWFKLNYEAGTRELLVKSLPGSSQCLILFSDKTGTFNAESFQIVDRISSQLATGVSNILANEQILKREKEKTFLLNFSNEIAAVRTKDDLEYAINNVLENVLHINLTMIRLIDDDGIQLNPFIYDKKAAFTRDELYQKLLSAKVTIHEGLTQKVLKSNEPVVFNIEEEEKRGNKSPYLFLWKLAGFKNAYGAPLRVGNIDLGTLWLLTNDVHLNLLKSICSQISIAIANIKANDKVLALKQMLTVENDHLKEQIKTIYDSDIIGKGEEMKKVYSLMAMVAPTSSTVLLLGETGTGKELVARGIHQSSPRKDKLMIKVNCAALPANLIESELFGHEKGAFTGAIERRTGKFELANNSTIFLDEIGEMPLDTQVKLLRVIQEREFERVGGKTMIKTDVRIIAATNRNLEGEVKAGRFRSDLYYRLNVFPITLPPLRNRTEDIEELTHFFLARYNKNTGRKIISISPNVMHGLRQYSWPGNVRELEHLIERSVLLTQGNILNDVQLPRADIELYPLTLNTPNKSLREVERSYIIETLRRCEGKISGIGGAAEILGIPPTTLHSKLQKLDISKADYFS